MNGCCSQDFSQVVYISFKKRLSVLSWLSANMVMTFVVVATWPPGRSRMYGKGSHICFKKVLVISTWSSTYQNFCQIGVSAENCTGKTIGKVAIMSGGYNGLSLAGWGLVSSTLPSQDCQLPIAWLDYPLFFTCCFTSHLRIEQVFELGQLWIWWLMT